MLLSLRARLFEVIGHGLQMQVTIVEKATFHLAQDFRSQDLCPRCRSRLSKMSPKRGSNVASTLHVYFGNVVQTLLNQPPIIIAQMLPYMRRKRARKGAVATATACLLWWTHPLGLPPTCTNFQSVQGVVLRPTSWTCTDILGINTVRYLHDFYWIICISISLYGP